MFAKKKILQFFKKGLKDVVQTKHSMFFLKIPSSAVILFSKYDYPSALIK